MGLLRRLLRGDPPAPEWVAVAFARHEPEAAMLAGILRDHDIPVFFRRTLGFDVPDMLAGGPRALLVPAGRAMEAHALLDPLEPIPADEG
jgi:hypothetical protein